MKRVPILKKTLLEVGKFFGRDRSTCEEWIHKGCPGKEGEYDLFEIAEWRCHNLKRSRKATQADTDIEEKKLALQARKLESEIREKDYKWAERAETVLPKEQILFVLERVAERLRQAGELLRKHHGDDAQAILHEALDDIREELDKSSLKRKPKRSSTSSRT